MHWSEKIAREIIDRAPNKDEYVCAAGISPSGSIHIGNFRDVATSLFVVQALRKLGKKARLLFSWDEFDRLRKIPKNVARISPDMEQYMEQFIGYPYVDVPNPFKTDCRTYAEYFEKEFEQSVQKFGLELDYRHQGEMYRSGKYVDAILLALQKRGEIFDILASFRTQKAEEGEREAYYPVSIYCEKCKRDTTTIVHLSDDCVEADYTCKCGHKGHFNFRKDFNCKLAWKVDWPMRWMYEKVDFEPGGKDHASPNGSYQTSKVIAEKIFHYPAPLFQGYEFIGIRGATGKMSGSSGLNLTPQTLLKIYQPEIILWLYSKSQPQKAFDFCFDDGILKQYFDFDKQYNAVRDGTADENTREIMEHCIINDRPICTVPMSLLVQLGSVVNFRSDMVKTLFEKINQNYQLEDINTRIELAKCWVEECAPDKKNSLRKTRNWDVYGTFNDEEKKDISVLYDFLLGGNYTLEELQSELYDIIKRNFSADTDFNQEPGKSVLREKQAKFFSNVYQLMIDKATGPRLYLFLSAIDRNDYMPLLDFSTPKTEEEYRIEKEEEEKAKELEKQAGSAAEQEALQPDEVAPVKAPIDFEAFSAMDLRVCKVLKCSEIRKSHNCLKLTLFDGIGERVIVSSIKKYYAPEDLIGRKIVVLVNLKPQRITGVTSEGMLLAATNNACGCKVVFADDSIPEGTSLA